MECGDFDLRTIVTILIVFWAIAAQLARAMKRFNQRDAQLQTQAEEEIDETSQEDGEELPPATLTPAERRALAERLGVSSTWIDEHLEPVVGEVMPRHPSTPIREEEVGEGAPTAAWQAGSLEIPGWLSTSAEAPDERRARIAASMPAIPARDAPPVLGLDLGPAAWRDAFVLHEVWHRPHRR